MEEYNKIVDDFKKEGWQSKPFERMLKLKNESPNDLLAFLKLCLSEIHKGGTFFDAALSYISEDEYKELISYSIDLSKKNGWTDIICSVIDYASLQFPLLLRCYLPELLNSRSNAYYKRWAWRKAGSKELNFLVDILESGSDELKALAWESLVNIRTESAILKAYDYFEKSSLRLEIGFDAYSKDVGFEVFDRVVRKLYQDNSCHIIFNSEYLDELDKGVANSVNYAALSTKNHPT